MASTLRQYYDTTSGAPVLDDATQTPINALKWFAQGFTPAITHTIDQVSIYGKRGGSPGDLVISIQGVDGSGFPDGTPIASGTLASASVSTDLGWVDVPLTSTAVVAASTTYCIIVATLTGTGADLYQWRYDSTSATYSGGVASFSLNSGSTWAGFAGDQDHMFREYGLSVAGTYTPVDKTYTKMLIDIGSNQVRYEATPGDPTSMTVIDAATGLDTTNPLTAVEAYQKIFIANGTVLKVLDWVNVKLSTADLNTHAPDPGTVLTETGGGEAKIVVEYITSTTADAACIIYGKRTTTATFSNGDTVTGTDNDDNAISFALDADEVAGPHWYDWTVFGQDASFGTMPTYATIVSLYRGRVTLAGNKYEPHMWYQFRVSDPFDLQTEDTDAKAAVAGNDARLGKIGDIVIATVPIDRDNWLIGTTGEMWLFTGDGAEGANLDRISKTTGMFGVYAHCIDDEGNVYFWGTNGLYSFKLPGGTPRCISRIRLPNIVKDGVAGTAVTQSSHRIVMAHDSRRKGILVFITTLADGTNANYFYDLTTKAFFPESYPDECGVFSAFYYDAIDPDYRELILGSYDGYLRFFDDSAVDDDAGDSGDTAINSYVALGPIALSQDPGKEGTFTGLDFVSAGGASGGSQSDSSDVGYSVFAAPSAEEVIEKLSANTGPNFAGTFTAPGRRHGSRRAQKISAVSFGVRLFNSTAAESWGFEKLFGDILPSGRFK